MVTTETVHARRVVERVTLTALFVGFLKVSLLVFGGGLVWARRIVVERQQSMNDQEFADFFAISQIVPGPNMILMMSFIGLKVGGPPGAVAGALATFGPACLIYYTAYRLWDRFRDRPWQQIVRRGLAPSTIGLVIAGGYVMARAADIGWQRALVTAAAIGVMLGTRLNPLWILAAGGILGGVGFV